MNEILSAELYPLFWLILALVLGLIEALTIQLVALWFALGALAAIVPAMLGAPMGVQFGVFAVVSVLALAGTRPFLKKVLHTRRVSTNADRVIGQVGVVIETVDNDAGKGRISVMGLDWAARSADNGGFTVGEKVTVLAIEGVKLIVGKKVPANGTEEE